MSFDTLRGRLKGPVYPALPAFNQDESLDASAVERYVAHLCDHGAKVVMVTAGTSRLNLLSMDETAALNKAVVRGCGGRAVTIAATPPCGSTAMAANLARRAEDDGADAVLLYYPERHYADDHVADYYAEVAGAVNIGLLIHGVPMCNGRGGGPASVPYSLDLCSRLADMEQVVGMKEEFGDENLRYKLGIHLKGRMALILAGASMRKFMSGLHFGAESYLVGVGSFLPEIEEQFFALVEQGDLAGAMRIVTEVEEPFFDAAFPMGWHVAMRAALSILDLMPPYERSPLRPASSEEVARLRAVMDRLGWLK